MRKLHFIILFLILIFSPKVFAQDFNVSSSDITAPGSSGTGKYNGTEIYNSGTTNVYNIGTRYNGRLSRIRFNLIAGGYADSNGFDQGHVYTLTMNMATEDWRNNFGSVSVKCEGSSGTELSDGRVSYISSKKIKFSFTAPSSSWCQFVYIDLQSSNISSTAFTGVSNWNLSSLVISDPSYSSGGSSTNPTPSPGSSNEDLINNNNQNTQSIINNNNQNTQDIIENNNQNTKDIINSNKENFQNCYSNLWNNGNISGDRNSIVSLNEFLQPGTYTISYNITNSNNSNTLFQLRDDSSNLINLTLSPGNGYKTFTISNTATKYRLYQGTAYADTYTTSMSNIMLVKGTTPQDYDNFGVEHCTNKLDETTNAINNLNDTMKDDNVENGTGTDFFNNFSDEDFGLSSIITIPLNTIQSLTSKSCLALSIPIPFTNSSVSLPCMTEIYEEHIPTVYNLWKIVSFGLISYFIAIDIFHMVKGFKDPESDKVEVLDL